MHHNSRGRSFRHRRLVQRDGCRVKPANSRIRQDFPERSGAKIPFQRLSVQSQVAADAADLSFIGFVSSRQAGVAARTQATPPCCRSESQIRRCVSPLNTRTQASEPVEGPAPAGPIRMPDLRSHSAHRRTDQPADARERVPPRLPIPRQRNSWRGRLLPARSVSSPPPPPSRAQ